MQTLLLVIELVIAIMLVVFILLQRSEGGALGIGGGGGKLRIRDVGLLCYAFDDRAPGLTLSQGFIPGG